MLSVVIPCHGQSRSLLFRKAIPFINRQSLQNFEVILVEQCKGRISYFKRLLHLFERPVIHIKLRGQKRGFNKNWCMNTGTRFASGKRVLWLDTDFIYDYDYFQSIAEHRERLFLAWNQLYYMSEVQTECTKNVIPNDNTVGVSPSIEGACGSAVCCDVAFLQECIGGHNENYFGWGLDDNDFAHRTKSIMGRFPVLKAKVYHMYHERSSCCSNDMNHHHYWTTLNWPVTVTRRLLEANLGRLEGPTRIYTGDINPR